MSVPPESRKIPRCDSERSGVVAAQLDDLLRLIHGHDIRAVDRASESGYAVQCGPDDLDGAATGQQPGVHTCEKQR